MRSASASVEARNGAVALAQRAKPVAEVTVDGGDRKTVRRARLGKQGLGRRDARERHAERHGETTRGRKPDTHAGEASRSNGHRNQRQVIARNARLLERRGDGGQQRGGLIAAFGAMAGERRSITHHRDGKARHRTIEGQHQAHG
jgi:hypothetical protein